MTNTFTEIIMDLQNKECPREVSQVSIGDNLHQKMALGYINKDSINNKQSANFVIYL